MRYTLKLRDIVIGWSELGARDSDARTAAGDFRPGLGYELVEPIFVLRPSNPDTPGADEQAQRYRRARDTLQLSLHTDDGALVDTSRIDIRPAPSGNGLIMEVAIVDPGFWLPAE